MPPLAAASTVSLRELADLAIGTPEAGAVNFTALHTLIVAMLKNLHLQDTEVDFLSLSPEQSRSFEVPRASLSTPQVAVSKERRRSSVAKVPPKTLESQVKHLGGQVKDLNQRFKTVDSQLQNVLTHVQYFTALVGGLDLGSPQWRLEQETATPMTQEATPMAEEASPVTLTTEKAPLMPRMAKLIPGKVKPMPGMAKLIPEMAKLMPEMATSATAVATLMPETAQTELMKILKDSPQAMELLQNVTEDVKMLKEAREKDQDNVKEFPELTPMKLLQRIEEVERLVKDTEDFLEPLSRKLNLTPAGEVNMVTWEELEQAITDGWKASQGGSESTTGPLKHKRQASMASSDKTPSTTSTKPSSMDQALDFAGGFGPDQTSPGTSRLGYPTEGAPSREQGKVSSSAGFPGREQHPRVHDGPGLARPQKPPVSQFRMEPDHHRPREQLGLADLRQGEQDVYPGPVPQDLPSARDRRSPVYPDSYGGVSTRPGPTYAGPPSLDQFELLHPSAYPHGVVPFSTSQLGMMPPGMGEQEFVLPGMGQYDMVPPWVPGRDQQGLEIPSMGQPGVFPFTTYQRDGRFPGPDQRGMEWTGVHGSDVGPTGMDQQGRIPPLTEQQMRGPPGVMQAATDRQGFAQPSLETSDFIPRGTQQQDAIPSGARQPGLVQPGRDQRGLVQPVVDQRGFVQPGVDQRGLVQPGVDQRGLVQPGVDQRGLVQPGVDQRGLVQPGVGQRGFVLPGVDRRGLVQPGVDQRGLVQSGVDQRGLVHPGVDQRGFVLPGVDQRGLVQPGVDQRGLVQPGVGQWGFVLPGVDQRGLVQPGVDQRGLVQPGVDQRGLVQPGVDQRGLVQPGVDQRGLVHPGVDQRGLVQPGVDQRGLVHPGVDQRGLVQPGVDQRGLVHPGVDQRGLVQPGVDQRGLVQPGVGQQGLLQPGVDQQGLVQPGVDQRGLVQPGVDQQGLVQAGVDQRGLVQPGVDQRGLVQPGVDQQGLLQPGVDQRGLVQPGVDQPGLGLPGVDQPGLGLPGVDQQGLVQPGVDQQGLVQPGVDQQGLVQPGVDQQGLVQPGVDQWGLGLPGVDQPGLGLPGVDQQGLVQPGVDQQGLVQPGVDQQGLVQPGVDQPGLVQPGVDQRGLVQPGVDQPGLVQPEVDQQGLVQPGVDQRGLVQPGVDQWGLVQPGVDQPGLVQPGVGQRGLVQPGAYPHSLVQPGAYPRGLLQPAAYPRGFMQPGTGRYGLVQPGIDQRGLRQLGADHRGWVPLGTEIRGFPFHVDSEGFTSPHPYQHDMVRFGRDRHSLVSPFPTPQGLPLPGIHQEGLVPTEAYAQGLMPPDTDQRRPTPVSPGGGSAHADQQHLESPVPDQWGQIGPSADQHDRERSISDYRGPRGPGHPGVEQYAQGGLDPSQPGTTTSRDAPFPRSADSLDSLHRVASERGSIPRERHDSLEKVAPSFPIAVETFRLMGELTGLYMELKKTMKELDEKKSGQTDLEKIQYLLSLMVQKTVPPDLQEQLKAIKSLTKEVRQEKVQLEKMQKILDGEGYQETGKEIKPGHLGLQLGVLRVTVADIEKELAELRKSQEQGQVSMEHSVSEASLYLQDQLDKLRTVIESMLSSSSTLLSLSMPPPKAPITLAPGQIDPEATCPACSLNLSHQVCTLVQRYEQLQNMVNNLSASRPSKKAKLQSQDEELLDRVQKAILQVQGDCEKLNATTSSLIEDHRQKQKDIDVLYQGLEKLDKEKANREHLEMGMDVKADKSALAAKVSRVQFDATTEQLNHMMQELVAKMTGQEQDWQKMLDKLLTEMDGKLDRLELDPVKQLLEDRWKALRQQLKERSPFYQADEAAAMRRQLLAHFHCLSCDRPLETPVTGKVIPVTPVGPSLPGHRSMRPYTVFELEQIRQQSRNLKLGRTAFPRAELAPLEQSVGRLRTMHSKMLKDIEKVQTHFGGSVKASSQMIHELLRAQCLGSPCYKRVPDMANYTCPAVPRRCGGSHTLAYPFRRSRLQHLPQCRDPEEVQIAMKHNEVDILGLDGHIYKGRLDTRLPGIPSKGSPVTTKQKNKPSRPYAHRQPFVSDDRQLPSRPQSAQMLAGDTPAPSHQRTDRPVSSEGRLSQQNLAHPPSPRERAAGLEIHVNVPPGEGPEEPTRGPRSFTAH